MNQAIYSAVYWFRTYSQRYPQAWNIIEAARARRLRQGADFTWPEWCYVPHSVAGAIVSAAADDESARAPVGWSLEVPSHATIHQRWLFIKYFGSHARWSLDTAVITALAAWRPGKGIYRFDPTLQSALATTVMDSPIPIDVLTCLPEWCVYIDNPVPGVQPIESWAPLHGAWVHLLPSPMDPATIQLRFLLDFGAHLCAIPVDLGATLSAGFASAIAWPTAPTDLPHRIVRARESATALYPILEMLGTFALYLCSEVPDIPDPRPTRRESSARNPEPRVWDVGVRVGAVLRHADTLSESTGLSHPHRSPRAHLRKAHWHTFLRGPRVASVRVIRWLYPIEVNFAFQDTNTMPGVVHPVEPDPVDPYSVQ
jgi:hypothetical protein